MSTLQQHLESLPKRVDEEVEHLAMNIVYQLDDDSGLSVDFRQANNDRRIDFVKGLIKDLISDLTSAIKE